MDPQRRFLALLRQRKNLQVLPQHPLMGSYRVSDEV